MAAALQEQILAPRHRILGELLAAGVDRGEVRPEALTPECIQAGPALLRQQFIESGEQPSEEAIRLLVDNVLIPMLRAGPQPAGPATRSVRPVPSVRTDAGEPGRPELRAKPEGTV